jgi:hypothetical protein
MLPVLERGPWSCAECWSVRMCVVEGSLRRGAVRGWYVALDAVLPVVLCALPCYAMPCYRYFCTAEEVLGSRVARLPASARGASLPNVPIGQGTRRSRALGSRLTSACCLASRLWGDKRIPHCRGCHENKWISPSQHRAQRQATFGRAMPFRSDVDAAVDAAPNIVTKVHITRNTRPLQAPKKNASSPP